MIEHDHTHASVAPAIHDHHEDAHEPHEHDHATHSHSHSTGGVQWLLKTGLFLGMSGYFGYLWLSGNLGNYINARFVWLSIVSALLFLVLGLASLYAFLRARAGGEGLAYGYHDFFGHTHPRLTLPIFAILAAPLLLGILVPSRPLGASAVGGDLLPAAAPSDSLMVISSNSLEWSVVDWLRAFYYSGNPDRLNGRDADVIGFVYRRAGDPSGYFMVARFMMSCCTADTYAIGLPVAWAEADNLAVDTWVRVQGPVRVGQFGKNTMPIIQASSVDASVAKPAQPYLYP